MVLVLKAGLSSNDPFLQTMSLAARYCFSKLYDALMTAESRDVARMWFNRLITSPWSWSRRKYCPALTQLCIFCRENIRLAFPLWWKKFITINAKYFLTFHQWWLQTFAALHSGTVPCCPSNESHDLPRPPNWPTNHILHAQVHYIFEHFTNSVWSIRILEFLSPFLCQLSILHYGNAMKRYCILEIYLTNSDSPSLSLSPSLPLSLSLSPSLSPSPSLPSSFLPSLRTSIASVVDTFIGKLPTNLSRIKHTLKCWLMGRYDSVIHSNR